MISCPSTLRLLRHYFVPADPDATYTKLTDLPLALIWYQVALLGTRNKKEEKWKDTKHIFIVIQNVTNPHYRGWDRLLCNICRVRICGVFARKSAYGPRADNAHSVWYFYRDRSFFPAETNSLVEICSLLCPTQYALHLPQSCF